MKILLINSNPVVSRLTALSARKEEIHIDEVQEINEVNNSKYDIVFVDSDSWSKELDSVISKKIQTQKRVLFYAQDDKNSKELFDITILKPFLPSEVSAVIRSVEEDYLLSPKDTKENFVEVEEESIFNTLETSKDKKEEKEEDFLISLDDTINLDEKVSKSVDEIGKNSIIKDKEEDLFAELKDNSTDFDKQLNEAFPSKKEEDLFDLDFSDDVFEKEFDILDKKSIKEEKDELFNFDFDNTEFDLNLDVMSDNKTDVENKINSTDKKEENIDMPSINVKKSEPKVETKILDESEVLNIKDILENDDNSTIELDELMTTPAVEMIPSSDDSKKKEKKKKVEKVDESSSLEADTLIETINSLPINNLKELLAGSTIKITIKFPKVK
ncbi:Highly acidic protein [hydrothermal vent metagenome]|uniref:Highly acidic protein n=2 Tax=hydrothermal vent metagenome TaxID=652676 RepID=A0A1W1BYF7_9ZZZZ